MAVIAPESINALSNGERIIFTESSNRDQLMGFNKQASTENAQFLFSFGTEEEMAALVYEIDMLINTARNKYGLFHGQRMLLPKIYLQEEGTTRVEHLSTYLYLTKDESRGAVFYFMSRGKLPAWLCVGLELLELEDPNVEENIDVKLWYNEAVANGLPMFSDLWFIPGFIENELTKQVSSVSYAFVKYLDELGLLNELIDLYTKEDESADFISGDAFFSFIGENEIDFSTQNKNYVTFRYLFCNNAVMPRISTPWLLPVYGNSPSLFTVYGKYAQYFFAPDDWTYDLVLELIEACDDGILYAKNWLEYEGDQMLNVYFDNELNRSTEGNAGIYRGDGNIFLYTNPQNVHSVFIITHEAVHAFLDIFDGRTNFPKVPDQLAYLLKRRAPFLEEGLCTVIQHLHYIETENNFVRDVALQHVSNIQRAVEDAHFGGEFDFSDSFIELFFNWCINTEFNSIADVRFYLDIVATFELDFIIYQGFEAFGEYPHLQSYETSASFILYLLEQKGTKDDFRRFFKDIYLAEEIYGVDIDGMIEEWLVYLEKYQ